MPTIQISAHISADLKTRLDQHARATGVTRAHLVAEALSHHLEALASLPPDAIVPKHIVLSPESAARVRDLLERPSEPTEEMKRLFNDR